MPCRRFGASDGLSLIEVLVALTIVTIGMLGMAKLQTSTVRFNHGAFLRTQATLQAYDIADRMRANLTAVQSGAYDNVTGTPADPGCLASGCTPAQMAQYDAYEWNTLNANILPGGTGTVVNAGASRYTITLSWIDPDPNGITNQSFSTTFQP